MHKNNSKTQNLLLLSLSSLLSLPISYSSVRYEAQLEMHVKAGNLRNLGRVSLLVPLYQKDSSLLYFNGIGMFDSTDNSEGKFGIGL